MFLISYNLVSIVSSGCVAGTCRNIERIGAQGSDSVMSLCRNFMHVAFHVCLELCLKLNEFISACDDLCLLGFLFEEAEEHEHSAKPVTDLQEQIHNKTKLIL